MSLRELKQNRQKDLEKIADEFKKHTTSNTSEGYEDNRFWYPDVDKMGNGIATIRFLPTPEGEDTPTVKLYRHSFQGPTGKWYINNCLSTIKGDDPVNELNKKLCGGLKWEVVPEKIKEVVRNQKRKIEYITNIYVVSDPAHPENEGKVWLFRFGPQIHGILKEKMYPTFEGEERINPFDLWGPDEDGKGGGANFKLKITLKDKRYRNYEKSEFLARAPLFKEDEKLEDIYSQLYPLQPFIAPDQFKPREELQARLTEVLGTGPSVPEEDESPVENAPIGRESKPAWEADDEVDENFFKNLAEE